MRINTKVFGEIEIIEEKIIHFPSGIIGFPGLTDFALVHDEEKGIGAIHWLQSIQEPGFAMPVMDPLLVKPDYNPEVDDELLKPIGDLEPEELLVLLELPEEMMLVMVTVTVPGDIKQMSVNLKGPIIVNASKRKACQVIVDGGGYAVKFPVYEILNAKKAGE